LVPKVVRVEKPDEADQIRQLKKQIRQLQEALGKTQLENVMNESFLRIACEQLSIDFEEFKKSGHEAVARPTLLATLFAVLCDLRVLCDGRFRQQAGQRRKTVARGAKIG
jgi:hypothetical protein